MYIPNLVETGDVLNTEQNGLSGELIGGKPHQGYEQRDLISVLSIVPQQYQPQI
jgi:hypothetical protein